MEREAQKETGIKGTAGVRTRTGMATDINADMQTTSDHDEIAARMTNPEIDDDRKAPTTSGRERRTWRKLEPSRITSKVL